MEFRISVCLTRYFEDERSYCYVMVDERQERVASLEQRLRALFALPGSFCLMSKDHYLPREERLSILRPEDTVMIVPLENDWREQDDNKIQIEEKCKSEADADSEPADSAVLYSPQSAVFEDAAHVASSATNNVDKAVKKKKKKKFKPDQTNEPSTELEPASVSPPLPLESRHESGEGMDTEQAATDARGLALQQLKMKALSLLQEVATGAGAVSGVSSGRVTKRRRTRKRNRHSSLALASSSPPSPSPPPSAPPSPAPPATSAPPKSTHTRFSEMGVPPPPVLQNVAGDVAGAARGRVVRPESRPALEAGASVAGLLRRLHEFPIMDALTYPMPRDLVLFRTLRLEGGVPRTSGAVLGRVLRVDKAGAAVVFHVLEGLEELRGAGGGAAGGVAAGADGEVQVPWNSVLDPRLVFP